MNPPPLGGSQPMKKRDLFMFLTQVLEFVEFLSNQDHTLDEILTHTVSNILKPLDASSALISQINNENMVEILAQFAISPKIYGKYSAIYDLKDKYPVTDSIRNRNIVWINTLPQWPDEYPALANLSYDSGEKTFICFPIEKCGSPMAVLGIFCKPVIHPDAETSSFLKTIGNILSLYIYRNIDSPAAMRTIERKVTIEELGIASKKLTERQRLILRMMSEGRTNLGISELIGYSESTIRQETIKIFALLHCKGREEASKIYTEQLVHTEEFK